MMSLSLFKNNAKLDLLFSAVSGLIFLLIFSLGYKRIPNNYYEYRDDGLITLSHARNLADYGTISINPSGDRVEGFSAPTQFILYYSLYKTTGISYEAYCKLQTLALSFLLGFFFIKFFKKNYLLGITLSIFSAFLLQNESSFFEWHASGMENAITHFLFVLSIYLLFKMLGEGKINYSYTLIIFLTSISRIEFIYYIGPILLVFTIFWIGANKNYMAFFFTLIVIGTWLSFNLFRYIYFGDLLPNTAYAFGISVTKRLNDLLDVSLSLNKPTIKLVSSTFTTHYGYLIFLIIPLIFFVRKTKERMFIVLMLFSLIVLTCIYPVFFGEPRLDPSRTTTHMSVLVVLLICVVISQLKLRKHTIWIITPFLLVLLVFSRSLVKRPYYLPWSSSYFLKIRSELLDIQKDHDFFRPTVCNADLGVISWHKDFNIIDLGRIGSPIMARLNTKKSTANYLFEFAAPDLIEIHDAWSCDYSYLFQDKRFYEMYEPIREARTEWLKQNCSRAEGAKTGIWIRKDVKIDSQSRERLFLDKLRENLSENLIDDELEACLKEDRSDSSLYITRSAYRYLPELAKKGKLKAVLKLFTRSKSSQYDLAVLNSRNIGEWYKDAVSFINGYTHHENNKAFQATGTLEIKETLFKAGFYDDSAWTNGQGSIENLSYQINSKDKFLVLHTYGFMPQRHKNRLNLKVFINEVELVLSHKDELSFYFFMPEKVKQIRRIRIESSIFVPKKIKMNNDKRKLGIDIQSIIIK